MGVTRGALNLHVGLLRTQVKLILMFSMCSTYRDLTSFTSLSLGNAHWIVRKDF